MRFLVRLTLMVFVAATASSAQSGPDAVLARMDAAAGDFRAVSADLKRVTYTAILDDKAEESGSVRVMRAGQRGRLMLIEFTEPDPSSILFQDNKAEKYYPKIKTVEEYDLSKHKDLVQQFLLLSFGASGKDLTKSYTVAAGGEEMIGAEKTTRLELTPKNAKTRENISKVEMWISDAHGYPLRQKVYEPNGNYYLFEFSNVKWNPALTVSDLKLDLPPGVTRTRPGQ